MPFDVVLRRQVLQHEEREDEVEVPGRKRPQLGLGADNETTVLDAGADRPRALDHRRRDVHSQDVLEPRRACQRDASNAAPEVERVRVSLGEPMRLRGEERALGVSLTRRQEVLERPAFRPPRLAEDRGVRIESGKVVPVPPLPVAPRHAATVAPRPGVSLSTRKPF
jgi:hypothetical protein